MKRVLFFSILLAVGTLHAQDIFKKHGYNKEPLTLSKGRYKETFINENVMQIGTVLIDTRTDKVVKFLEEGATEVDYKAENTSRFLTMDPVAEKFPWQSPYVYASNNPVNRIDPTGMDDYSVNQNGHIVLVKKTKDETDRLIALGKNDKIEYNDEGAMTNASYTVNKDILGNQKESGKTTYMAVKGNEQAKGLFEFLSDNTTVEWGRVSYGKSSNYISTNNSKYDNGIQTIIFDKLLKSGTDISIKLIDHSHPDGSLPSGFPENIGLLPKGEGDKAFAKWLYDNFPKIAGSTMLRLYNPLKKEYIQFNSRKIFLK